MNCLQYHRQLFSIDSLPVLCDTPVGSADKIKAQFNSSGYQIDFATTLRNVQILRTCYKEHTEVEKRRRTFILDTVLHDFMKKKCFSVNVHQCNIGFSVF